MGPARAGLGLSLIGSDGETAGHGWERYRVFNWFGGDGWERYSL